jgi:hypothetical protein
MNKKELLENIKALYQEREELQARIDGLSADISEAVETFAKECGKLEPATAKKKDDAGNIVQTVEGLVVKSGTRVKANLDGVQYLLTLVSRVNWERGAFGHSVRGFGESKVEDALEIM